MIIKTKFDIGEKVRFPYGEGVIERIVFEAKPGIDERPRVYYTIEAWDYAENRISKIK